MTEKVVMEKKKEELIRQISQLGLSTTMHLHNQNQAPFELTSNAGSNLIPRVVVTNIMVYPIHIDLQMDLRRQQRSNNIQHGIRASANHNMDLHTAVRSGDIERVKKLADNNWELVRFQDPQGLNLPLHLAIMYGSKDMASYLIKKYPQGSYALNRSKISPIYLAALHRSMDLDLVESMLLEPVTDINAFDELRKGSSVVCAAIKSHNNLAMVQTILKYHPDLINCMGDNDEYTPLSCAAYDGFVDIVGYMINNFPESMSCPNKDKSYPIHRACLGGHVEVLKMFHSRCPGSVLYADSHGRTILHLAAKERNNKLKPVVSYLLSLQEAKKLIKKIDENERTPLDLARTNRNREVEGLIIQSMMTY